MARSIPLTKGKFAVVDDEDYQFLMQWSWCYNSGYACRGTRRDGRQIRIKMHRMINGTPEGMDTDHINRDKLDNRRSNLRTCNRSLNILNCDSRSDNSTGFRGVTYNKFHKKFMAAIAVNGNRKHLGYFDLPEDAYEVYRSAKSEVLEVVC